MSVRRYVGARYIPRFMGVYDVTQIYDALDIVDNGSGTSYIARKTVPAGTALTNTEYWAVYGAASGAIYDLQTRVGDIENDLPLLDGRIDALEDNYMPDMKDRVFLFLGDSYDVTTDYFSDMASYIKCKSYTKRSETGAGFFKQDPDRQHLMYINIISTGSPLTDEEKETVTDVVFVVAVGNDDANSISDLSNAIIDIDTYLRANLINLRNIHLYPVGWASRDGSIQERMRRNMSMYSHLAGRLGWKYIDCTRIMKSASYTTTGDSLGYHPTATGGTYMAQCVSLAILTGSCDWEKTQPIDSADFTPSYTNVSGTPTIVLPASGKFTFDKFIQKDGKICIRLQEFITRITGIGLLAANSYFDINLTPDIANTDPMPTSNTVYPLAYYDSEKAIQACVLAKFNDDQLKIRCFYKIPSDINNLDLRIITSNIVIQNQ